jgi:endoglucanase
MNPKLFSMSILSEGKQVMSFKRKTVVSSLLLVAIVIVGGFAWFLPSFLNPKETVHAAAPLPYNATANGPYSVKGNTIVGTDGKQYIFHGIGRDGLEYNCSGPGPFDAASLAHMGQGNSSAGSYYWGANTVRLPLSEGFWLNGAPGFPCTPTQYQTLVKSTIDSLTAQHMNVIIDLQWVDANKQSLQGGGPWPLPDADSILFWTQITSIYKSYANVLFEAYNEPNSVTWPCLVNGCPVTSTGYSDECRCSKTLSYPAVGIQQVVNTIRKAGANNLILVGGLNWGFDLSQVPSQPIGGGNIVYDTHPYSYADKSASTWDAAFGKVSANFPVISAENGEYDCNSSYLSQLYGYLDSHHIGWAAWAWTVSQTSVCAYPSLIIDYQGTPSNNTGQFVYQRLRGYAVSPGPTASTWYFAEGRVGAGFREFITLDNPDPGNSCIINLQFLEEGGTQVMRQYTVNPSTRKTIDVGAELNTAVNSPHGISLATVATNDPTSPCSGFVAERPMYFNYHGNNSGSDVVGATHTATTFNFADVASGSGYTSYLTILNPAGGQSAVVTANYYSGGKVVGTQNVTVAAGSRGTIAPGAISLPLHSAVIVSSTQPVVVERPSYATNVSAGIAGTITGASSVVGSQSLAKEWFLAEGFAGTTSTGSATQENLIISNLDPANLPAAVTINLEYINGMKVPHTITVAPMSQVIWNVNAQLNAPSKEVSADVVSTGAGIVVARQMFFNYSHTINTDILHSSGLTEVTAQIATYKAYNFAEGYNNTGYNEWLTLQNPTPLPETIYITLVNSLGMSSIISIPLGNNTRATFDVTNYVRANMVRGTSFQYYEISMTVQTVDGSLFVAERPQYYNTSGSSLPTQGGTVAFGYNGT